MSTTDLLGVPTSTTPAPVNISSLFRLAGVGGLLAFVTWLLQPIMMLFLIEYDEKNPAGSYHSAAEWANATWEGPYGLVAFAGVGIGIMLLTVGLTRAAELKGAGAVGTTVARYLGLLATTAYVLLGGFGVGWAVFGKNVADVTGNLEMQRLMSVVMDPISAGLLATAGVGLAGFFLWLGTAGRRLGLIGVPLAVLGARYVVAFVAPVAVNSQPMIAATLQPLLCLVLGIGCLLKSRR
jgi:hypothetical protein